MDLWHITFQRYYIHPNTSYPGPCPGHDAPPPAPPGQSSPSHIDTWCAVDEVDDNFYDQTLANATIKNLEYAAPIWHKQKKPFFIMNGFARPHAPWRVPKRIWDLYENVSIPLATNKYVSSGV